MYLEHIRQALQDLGISQEKRAKNSPETSLAKTVAIIPSQPTSDESKVFVNEEGDAQLFDPHDRQEKDAQFLEVSTNAKGEKTFQTSIVRNHMKEQANVLLSKEWSHPLLTRREQEINPTDNYFPEHLFTPEWLEIQKRLLRGENRGVHLFYGGPLELREKGISGAQVMPLAVDITEELEQYYAARSKEKKSNMVRPTTTEDTSRKFLAFHVVTISDMHMADPALFGTVHYFDGPEIELKLDALSDWSRTYQDVLIRQKSSPRMIIRRVRTGSLAFPDLHEPVSEEDIPGTVVDDALNRVRQALYIENLPLIRHPESTSVQPYEEYAEHEHLIEYETQEIPTELGPVFLTPVQVKNDPWQYYEILSFEPLRSLQPSMKGNAPETLEAYMEEMRRPMTMRLDSGCDSGMLYHDQGCDCHTQLMNALEAAKRERGFVVHIPLQDGRGYGMNTKMHTELLKQGGRLPGGGYSPPLTTIDAGKKVFGERYDIRTYEGVGKILNTFFPHRKFEVITDNRRKLEELSHYAQEAGISVSRRSAGVDQSNMSAYLKKQLEDKRRSGNYFEQK